MPKQATRRRKTATKKAPTVKTTHKKLAPEVNIGKEIDRYYKMRAKRLEHERKIDDMKKEERELKAQLIMQLGAHGLDRAAGKSASVSVSTKLCPRVESWPEAYEWLRENDCLHLLQKRWNESALREMWEDGKKVPGVQPEPVVDLHLSKLAR